MADEVDNKWNGKIYKGGFVYIDNQKIEVNPAQLEKLKEHKKYKDE
jgi:predicted SprT family Zn-dependent metalloprotease